MLARPFASETVIARAVWRLKCSVVANVAANPTRPPRSCASAGWADDGDGAVVISSGDRSQGRVDVAQAAGVAGGAQERGRRDVRRVPAGHDSGRDGEVLVLDRHETDAWSGI